MSSVRARNTIHAPEGRRAAAKAGSQPGRRTAFWQEKQLWGGGVALLALCLLAYLPALRGGFVWDDVALTENPLISSLRGVWDLWLHPALNVREEHYWPLVYTSFWAEYRLWGLAPFGYHLSNVLLHAANAFCFWRILRRLGVAGAWLAACVFAVHPVHVESVAWVIERKDVLAGLFYFLGALAYLHFEEKRNWGSYVLALCLLVAGMLSKSIVVTLPLALGLCLWWRRGKVAWSDLKALSGMLALGGVLALADVLYGRSLGSAFDPGVSLLQRPLLASRAVAFYVSKLLWPVSLVAIYPQWNTTGSAAVNWGALIAVAGVLLGLFAFRKHIGRGPFAAAACYVVTLGPVLGFIGFGFMKYSYVADRFQYLASAGPIALVCAGAVSASDRWAARIFGGSAAQSKAARLLAGALLVVLGALTWHYSAGYGDAELLWTRTLAQNPKAWEAHHHLGLALSQQGKFEEGLVHFQKALSLRPDYAEGWYNLGMGLQEMKRDQEAARAFQRAIELNSAYAQPHNALGAFYAQQGKYAEAEKEFREALRLDPTLSDAEENLRTAQSAMQGGAQK